jgi:hypothetical protein
MKAHQAMKPILFALVALFGSSFTLGADAPQGGIPIAAQDSFVWAKLTSSMSSTSSKPGDPVTAVVMGPAQALEGATMEGTVDRADQCTLAFSFHTLELDGKTYPIQSRIISIVNSKGVEGQDDLGQRIRMGSADITAYGITTALHEGAELHLSVWKRG